MMKNSVKSLVILFALCLLVVVSCSKEDSPPPQLTAADFTTTIEENPQQGDVLGTVVASASEGVTFSIANSDPQGAFAVNATTGEVTVADASLFDFETRTSATANVSVENGTQQSFASVFVTITNADDILTLLTTSRQAYMDETSGWVQITEAEYNLLAERMADIFKVGVSDFDYGPKDGDFISNITISNSTNITIPFGSYFFAFRYTASENVPEGQVRPKISNSGPITGFTGQGPLPPHEEGDVFFVKKGQNEQTTAGQAYLALYTPYQSGWVENTSNTLYYRVGNGSDLPLTTTPFQALQQGLTTTLKQWD